MKRPEVPYTGLRPFERHEFSIFFGREKQTHELLAKLKQHHFIAVLGSSGSGKSSLVKAGLIPSLEQGYMGEVGVDWSITEMRPGDQPFIRLAEALLLDEQFHAAWGVRDKGFLVAALQRGSKSLHEILAKHPLNKGRKLLILVDQFEEIFRYRREVNNDQAAAFVALLLQARLHNDVYVIITMRSDFLGDASRFYGLPEAINQGLYLTPRLTRDQLRDAIALPVTSFTNDENEPGHVEDKLVNYLLNQEGGRADSLPLLQHSMRRLWDLDKDKTLKLHEYHEECRPKFSESETDVSENASENSILNNHLEQVWTDELSPDQQKLTEQIFRVLAERRKGKSIRNPATLQTLVDITGHSETSIRAVVAIFSQEGRNFLHALPSLDSGEAADAIFIDISHESLIRQWGKLDKWVEKESKAVDLYSELRSRALKEGELLIGRDLEDAEQWLNSQPEEALAHWAYRYDKQFQKHQSLSSEIEKNFPIVKKFITESVEARKKLEELERKRQAAEEKRKADEEKRKRKIAYISFFVLALFSSVLLWAWVERERADIMIQAQKAEARQALAETELAKAKARVEVKQAAAEREAEKALQETRNAELQARLAQAELALATAKNKSDEAEAQLALVGVQSELEKEVKKDSSGKKSGNTVDVLLQNAAIYAQFDAYQDARGLLKDIAESIDSSASTETKLRYELLKAQVDLASGEPEKRLLVPALRPLYDIAYDKRNQTILAAGENGGFYVGQADQPLQSIDMGVKVVIPDIAVSAGSEHSLVALAINNGNIFFRKTDAPNVEITTLVDGNASYRLPPTKAIAFSADGEFLATGHTGPSGGVFARVWRVSVSDAQSNTVNLIPYWRGRHEGQISEGGLQFLSAERLATVSHDGYLRIWQLRDEGGAIDINEPVLETELESDQVFGLALSPDGSRLAVSDSTKISIWNVNGNKEAQYAFDTVFATNHSESIYSLLWLSNEQLVSSSADKTLRVWDVNQGALLRVLEGHDGIVGVSGLAYDDTNQQLYSPGTDGQVLVWKPATDAVTFNPITQSSPRSIAYSLDRKTLMTGLDNGQVLYKTGDSPEKSVTIPLAVGLAANSRVTHILPVPDRSSHLVVIASRQEVVKDGLTRGVLTVWQLENGQMLQKSMPLVFEKRIESIAFSADGQRLYIAGLGGRVHILKNFEGLSASEGAIDLSDRLLSNNAVYPDSDSNLQIRSIQLSADGKTLLMARKREVQLWNVGEDGFPVQSGSRKIKTDLVGEQQVTEEFPVPRDSVQTDYDLYGAAFAPVTEAQPENKIVAFGRGASVELYPLNNRKFVEKSANNELRRKVEKQRLRGHTNTVVDAGFIPEADVLLTTGADATLRGWELDSGNVLFVQRLASHSGYPMPFYDFDAYCDFGAQPVGKKCEFAFPFRGKDRSGKATDRYSAEYEFKLD